MNELEALRMFYADVQKVIEMNDARIREMNEHLISDLDVSPYVWFEMYGKKEGLREIVSQLRFAVSCMKDIEGGEKK